MSKFNWIVPVVGGSKNVWGTTLNTIFSNMDSVLQRLTAVSDSAPSDPSTGDLWADTVNLQLKVWTGSAWSSYGAVIAGGVTDNLVSIDASDNLEDSGKAKSDIHTRKHDIDGTDDHTGVSGATEDNFISFDASGLPKDSGKKDADYADATHKDTHDPEDGGDPLDCAAPAELASVQASGEGSSHSFARADHAHQIQHSIADNHIVTVDGAPVDNDFARFTADGLEGRSYAEVMADLSGQAGADFAMNTHKITGVVDPVADQDAATKIYVDGKRYIDTKTSITVGAAKDYATIQEALDSLEGYIIADCTVTISVDAGSYDEAVVTDQFLCTGDGIVLIQGDGRSAAGASYAVSGVTKSTNELTYTIATMAGTYTDWDTDDDCYLWGFGKFDFSAVDSATQIKVDSATAYTGASLGNVAAIQSIAAASRARKVYTCTACDDTNIEPGMKAYISGCDDGANDGFFTIVAVTATTITVINDDATVQAGAGGEIVVVASHVSMIPDRAIDRTSAGRCIYVDGIKLEIEGLYLETSTGTSCHGIEVVNGGYVDCINTLIVAQDYGVYVNGSGNKMLGDLTCSFVDCDYGVYSQYGGVVDILYGVSLGCAYHYYARNGGQLYAAHCVAVGGTVGFYTRFAASLICNDAEATGCTYGFYTQNGGSLYAQSSEATGCTYGHYALMGSAWSYLSTIYACTYGIYSRLAGPIDATSASVTRASYAYRAAQGGIILCKNATAEDNTIGYHSSYNSYINAASTNANNSGNSTDYSPAVSDTQGNVYALITWS